MTAADLPQLCLALAIVILAARIFGMLASRAGQPEVVGEILAGILLGPSVIGQAAAGALFPTDVRSALATLANIAVCVFMFFVGLHFDRDLLRGQARIATSVSLGAIVVPFALGCLLALYLAGRQSTPDRVGFVLFLGTALSITAFPVLARILHDTGLVRTTVGGLALACAAVDDVLAWALLAVVVAISGATAQLWPVLLVVPFAVLLITVVRPLLDATDRRLGTGRLGDFAMLAVVGSSGLFLCAQATDRMGLHVIFGAFLFGISFPRGSGSPRRTRLLGLVERLNAVLLLPVFFLIVGLQFDLVRLDAEELAIFALILVVAVGGKAGGAYVGARLCGAGPRDAMTLAVLLNTRGLTELIALTTGVQLGLLDTGLYSQMVVMALVTTGMTGVLLRFVYPPERVRRDIVARESVGVPT